MKKKSGKTLINKLLIVLIFLCTLIPAVNLKADTDDYTDEQWYFQDEAGALFPGWNSYEEDGSAIRNIPQVNDEDVVVAVLDTGIDYNHEDLKNVMWEDGEMDALKDFGGSRYGYDAAGRYVDGQLRHDDPIDEDGHGTHVAGIIAAEWNHIGVSGALNGVKLMAVRTSSRGNIDYVKAGMEYVLAAKRAGVNVAAINLSWNGGVNGSTPEILYDVIEELIAEGVVICMAAGNEYTDLNDSRSVSSFYRSIPGLIVVAASDQEQKQADFSNYGSHYVHVGAPGNDILSTYIDSEDEYMDEDVIDYGGYRYEYGTSMATPVVTAAAALLYAYEPDLSAEERAARIIETSDHEDNSLIGAGLLNIEGMLDNAILRPYLYGAEYDGETLTINGYDLGEGGSILIDGREYPSVSWNERKIMVETDDLLPGEHYISVNRDDGIAGSYWLNVVADTASLDKRDSSGLDGFIIETMTVGVGKIFAKGVEGYTPDGVSFATYDPQSGEWQKYFYDDFDRFRTFCYTKDGFFWLNPQNKALYLVDFENDTETKVAQLETGNQWLSDFHLYSSNDHIYLTYAVSDEEYKRWTHVLAYRDGSFSELCTISEDQGEVKDIYENDEGINCILSSLIDYAENILFSVYRINEDGAEKLPFEKTVGNSEGKPKAYGYKDTVVIAPVVNTYHSEYGDHSICVETYIDEYDLKDVSLIERTKVTGGHLSALSNTSGRVDGDMFYLIGSGDSLPHNSFIYRIRLKDNTPHKIELVQSTGVKISSDHETAKAGEVITLKAETDEEHEFVSWLVKDEQGKEASVEDDRFIMPDSDVSVSAIVRIRQCTISFDGNGGSGEMESLKADLNSSYELPVCRFTAPEDKLFGCWIVTFRNSESIEMNAGEKITISDDVILKAKWKNHEYRYEGGYRTWTKGDHGSLSFLFRRTVNDEKTFGNFESLKIDGQKISTYKAVEGSLRIILEDSYLNTLTVGEHVMDVYFSDGFVSCKFRVKEKEKKDIYKVPVTGIEKSETDTE